MGRPKGSKNKKTIELEEMQKKIRELEQVHNSYDDVVDAFTEGFVMDLFNRDVIKTVSNDTLQRWFNNPDEYMENITNLLTYYYIVDGNIFQLYDLIFTLPNLDYNITTLQKDDKTDDDLRLIKLFLEKRIRHKELTRDLAVQLASKGTILGTWFGNKKNPYFYTFDNLKYIYPYGRSYGKMIGVIDLKWLEGKSDEEKELIYQNLSPLITESKFKKYEKNKRDKENRYIFLPPDRSLVERIHTLSRNQRLGIPFGTQAIFDMQHKKKMKDLEISVANKIIRAIAVLKFKGKDDNDVKVSPKAKKKVFNKVRKALEMNTDSEGLTCIGIPDFANFDFPELKNGEKALNPEKYESINNDITTSTGVSDVLSNGTNGNYASANLNLDILYKKIGIILEKIEIVYDQLINIILGKRGENYIFSYNTERPLSKKEKLEALTKLHLQEGFSLKHVVDMIDDVDWQGYIDQSLYEHEVMDLPNKIKPYSSSYTSNGENGRPSDDNSENDNTDSSKSNGGNDNPKPSN